MTDCGPVHSENALDGAQWPAGRVPDSHDFEAVVPQSIEYPVGESDDRDNAHACTLRRQWPGVRGLCYSIDDVDETLSHRLRDCRAGS